MNGDSRASDENGRGDSIVARFRALFGKNISADDIAAAIDNGDEEATQTLSVARREMIERVVAFDEKKVVDVMAPRADIFAVDINTPLDELVRIFSQAGHSRMPIYRGDLDDPIWMVHIKDVIGLIANSLMPRLDQSLVIKDIRREILYVPPSMLVTDLLLRMQAARIHMALVIDEYGGTDGLVTIEDLVEEIVGEINDEHDEEETPAVSSLSSGGWEADARVELAAFEEQTGLRVEADDDEVDTIGGFVVSLAGRVPQRGEVLPGPDGMDFEVVEADARKVRKIRINASTQKPSEAAE